MSSRSCEDCGIPVEGRRRKRCASCRLKFRAERERDRYSNNAEAISERRFLRRQGAPQAVARADEPVVDYRFGGSARPSELRAARPAAQHWAHDSVTRTRMQRAMDADEPDQATRPESWESLQTRPEIPVSSVMFYPSEASLVHGGNMPYDEPAMLSDGLRGELGGRVYDNPAIDGRLYRPSSGARELHGHLTDRWGGRLG